MIKSCTSIWSPLDNNFKVLKCHAVCKVSVNMDARKQLLNDKDIINFNYVPEFIVNSFFGNCTYKNRLLVSTFCYLNGIAISYWNWFKGQIGRKKTQKKFD